MESWLEPLYDAEGIRAVDAWAIGQQGVPSEQLMGAAARALAEAVAALTPQGPIRVLCGKGAAHLSVLLKSLSSMLCRRG